MAERKRKERDEGNRRRMKSKRSTKTQRKKTGPRLPSSLQKEVERLNPTVSSDSIDSDDDMDIYEYEEERAEEESKKNKRYDPVAVNDDLSDEFEDENVQSDDENEDDDDDDDEYIGRKRKQDAQNGDSGEEVDERHARMLQRITGMPSEAFEDNKKKKMKDDVVPELYPESEYNPSRDVVDGDGRITIEDLLNPLRENPGYGKLRKRIQQIEKNARTVYAPLSTAVQAKVDRKAAYEISKKDVTKWQHIIQRNREAPSIFFDENVDIGFSTVGAIASEFEPRSEFEKKMAALVHDDKVMEAHKKDGFRLLEMNTVSVEDEKDKINRIAKMRSLLLKHEMKAKRIKKIKSRTFHCLLKKDRLKAESSRIQMDPEAAKEYAMKQERLRAEERMTLKHKNQNRWAKRILQRGLNSQDEGTRAAIAEQLQRHAELTRKMHSMKGSSSSDDTSDEDDGDENSDDSDQDRTHKLLAKAKEKTMKVLEEEDEVPKSGLLSLPFMRRGLEKRKEAAVEEANLALQEFEDSLMKLEKSNGSEDPKPVNTNGRRVFGPAKAQISDAVEKVKSDNFYGGSDSEDDLGGSKSGTMENGGSDLLQKDADDPDVIQEDTDIHQKSVFKDLDEIIKNPGPKTTYEVSLFASDTWQKAKNRKEKGTNTKESPKLTGPIEQEIKDAEKQLEEDSDTDSEGQMVDGILSSGSKPYELPSQEELIRQAFAGDDVEDDFEKDKLEILNEENPEPEKPLLLPGWGQWTHVQQKKGLPSWMLKKHEDAQKRRAEALKKRKDAHLKNVIISEKIDKKAEKLHTKVLPYPFTSKEVFEQSMRVPIGPEFNPASAVGALNRPEVVKRPGVIIKPIGFEEVNTHEKPEQRSGDKHKAKKNKGKGVKSMKKTKVEGKS